MRRYWVGLALALVACRSSLPSTEPLGVGPKADTVDAGIRATARADAGPSDAGASAQASAPKPGESGAETPKTVATEDAGAKDAAPSTSSAADSGAGGTSAAGALAVAGEYHGWDTTSYSLPNAPPPERDPNARTRVVQGSGDAIELVIINSANGQDMCSLKGKLKASNVTLDKGQHCFEEGEGMLTASLRKGSAKFSGKRLVMDLEFDLEVDTGQGTISGDIVYHFEGDRK